MISFIILSQEKGAVKGPKEKQQKRVMAPIKQVIKHAMKQSRMPLGS